MCSLVEYLELFWLQRGFVLSYCEIAVSRYWIVLCSVWRTRGKKKCRWLEVRTVRSIGHSGQTMAFVNIEAAFLTVVQRFLRRKRKTDLPRSRVSFIFIPVLMNFLCTGVSHTNVNWLTFSSLFFRLSLWFGRVTHQTVVFVTGYACHPTSLLTSSLIFLVKEFHLFLNLLVSSSPLLIKVGTQAFDLHEMGIEKKRWRRPRVCSFFFFSSFLTTSLPVFCRSKAPCTYLKIDLRGQKKDTCSVDKLCYAAIPDQWYSILEGDFSCHFTVHGIFILRVDSSKLFVGKWI